MYDLAGHLGLTCVVDVTFVSLSISHQADPTKPPRVQIRQVKQRDLDYQDLTRVDYLVHLVMTDQIDLAEARTRLTRLMSSQQLPPFGFVALSWGLMGMAVALELGGTGAVLPIAFLAAVCLDLTQTALARRGFHIFYRQIVGGAIATVVAAVAAARIDGLDPSLVVTANIIILLAGVSYMGAFHDALTGYYITAGARLLEATLATGGIIAGVSLGLSVANWIGVDIRSFDPGRTFLESPGAAGLGAALAGVGFAMASGAPRRALLPIAAMAGVAMGVFQVVTSFGLDRPWASGIAAVMVGLMTPTMHRWVGVPGMVLAVSAAVPLLPGLLIFRGLSLLADPIRSSQGILAIITAGSVALALAAGVLAGDFVAHPVDRGARMWRLRRGPRTWGPRRRYVG
jgi:uncharacterized membrane protein YjjP (DUF1212 family)